MEETLTENKITVDTWSVLSLKIDGKTPCKFSAAKDEPERGQQIKYAHLLAAAPDMLEALKLVMDNCGNPNCRSCRAVRTVIDKATGKDTL